MSGVLAAFTHIKNVLAILSNLLLFVLVVLDLVHELLLDVERQLLEVWILLFECLKFRGVHGSTLLVLLGLGLWKLLVRRLRNLVRVVIDGQLFVISFLVEKPCFLEVNCVLHLSVWLDESLD